MALSLHISSIASTAREYPLAKRGENNSEKRGVTVHQNNFWNFSRETKTLDLQGFSAFFSAIGNGLENPNITNIFKKAHSPRFTAGCMLQYRQLSKCL